MAVALKSRNNLSPLEVVLRLPAGGMGKGPRQWLRARIICTHGWRTWILSAACLLVMPAVAVARGQVAWLYHAETFDLDPGPERAQAVASAQTAYTV
eukprot:scaffold3311_cov411-Prasinococcus_capsulatus_cf.AAC.3